MNTTYKINNAWNNYDKSVAKCHLSNYGIIFLDSFSLPVDDQYQTDELYNNLKPNDKMHDL